MEQERAAENCVVGFGSTVFEIAREIAGLPCNAKPLHAFCHSQPPEIWRERDFPVRPEADLVEQLSLPFLICFFVVAPLVEENCRPLCSPFIRSSATEAKRWLAA